MSAPSKVQLVGGNFQDAEGNVVANGKLRLELVQDEQLSSSTGQICGGIDLSLSLDNYGCVNGTSGDGGSPQYVWPTDVMAPSGASYTAWVYTANGQLAWGPNYNLLVPSGGPFDVDTWLPNPASPSSASGGITLQTNGTNNGSQQLLDLQQGTGVTLINSGGQVTISASSSQGPRPGVASWHYYSMEDGSPTAFAGTTPQAGMLLSNDVDGTISYQGATATEPSYKILTSGASAGNFCGVSNDNSTIHGAITLGLMTDVQQRVQTPGSTHVRYWVCTISSYPGNVVGSGFLEADSPSVAISGYSCIGFRFSTAAGDTTWKCYAGNTTGSATIVDSGVAIDTAAGHIFELQQSAGAIVFLIDGVIVGTISTTLPATSVQHTMCLWADNVSTANAVAVKTSYFYWESAK
jgi:hypothetical protein